MHWKQTTDAEVFENVLIGHSEHTGAFTISKYVLISHGRQ